MHLVRATDQDNDRLLHYYTQSPFPGAIRLEVRRMFNFFNQYRLQSDDFCTYMILNERDDIEAMASLVFRQAIVDGSPQTIGYATDLRVSPNRRAITSWATHFMPLLEEERKKRNCNYIFTAVARSQRQAYNAFIRPRNLRRHMPRYHLFRRFQLITLHGLWPFHAKPLTGIKIRSAKAGDLELIGKYIVEKTAPSPLHYFDTAQSFANSLFRWNDLQPENFILAFDRNDKLIGCVAPWTANRVQRIYPQNYGPAASNMIDMLRVLSWGGVAHPMPPVGQEFEVRYLTHLHADNPDIFYSLLFHAYQNSGKKEFLLYPHFDGELTTLPPRSFISAQTNFGLYTILSPADPIPDFLKPRSLEFAPEFEPAFL
jgi:hypothetical protein